MPFREVVKKQSNAFMKVELVTSTIGRNSYAELDCEEIIAAVARHGKIKKDNGKLVTYLMDHKHWSPLTFINFTFKIQTRRSISAQVFRHRSLEAQEWSLRYDEPIGIERIELREEHPTNRQSSTEVFNPEIRGVKASEHIEQVNAMVLDLYKDLIAMGVAKECARDILPLATKTVIHLGGNLRDLLSFLNVRMDEHAQKEIKIIANEIGLILEQELPNIIGRIEWRNGLFM